MKQKTYLSLIVSCILSVASLANQASAAVVVYDNTTSSFSGFGLPAGGTATGISRLIADDITPISGYSGLDITSISFAVANLNLTALTARARIRFWLADGSGDGPGTLITAFSFNPVSFAANSIVNLNFNLTTGQMVMPAGKFWAGIQFDNASGSTATAAEIDNFGVGLFAAPVIGTSGDDTLWQSTSGANQVLNNPTGSFVSSVNPDNTGWKFTVVPEPTSLALFALGGMAAIRRRR